ncbi:MAG TPA: MaoC/PaaZ C-terminal domain-containing protein [Acidimicrobiales bacterium]|nr:MaoC/PaaZ C-terminal domain-containing protein [Acidimicrobiales bacterium]
MPINPDVVGMASEPVERSWTSTDCLLYAVGVGAGSLDAAGFELDFTTENSVDRPQRVLPTFAAVVGGGGPPRGSLGSFDPAMLVHGEQSIELFGPIPPAGTVRTTSTVTGVFDKGSGAVVVTESRSVDARSEEPRFTATSSLFVRGGGGFGGDRGPSGVPPAPEGEPDDVVSYTTRQDQALLYRLSGDRNPLHSDPVFAERAGFDRPILHGLCTFGFAGRALLHAVCGSDPGRVVSMAGRFSRPTLPGDTLNVSIWAHGDGVRYRTDNQRGETVIAAGSFVFS